MRQRVRIRSIEFSNELSQNVVHHGKKKNLKQRTILICITAVFSSLLILQIAVATIVVGYGDGNGHERDIISLTDTQNLHIERLKTARRLEHMGLSREFRVDDLPPWSQVLDNFNSVSHDDEPVILGLEHCPKFREEHDSKLVGIGPAGLFSTGTNLIHDLIRRNCKGPKGRHSKFALVQVPYGKHNPADARFHHHVNVPEVKDRSAILPVVTIRHPYTWMSAMCKKSYGTKWKHLQGQCHKTLGLKNPILEAPWGFKKYNETHTVKNSYESLAHMWKEWYTPYFLDEEHHQTPRLMVRHEDMVYRPQKVVKKICECVGGTNQNLNSDWEHPDGFHYEEASANKGKGHGDGRSDLLGAVVKYGQPLSHWYEQYSSSDRAIMKAVFQGEKNPELRKIFETFQYKLFDDTSEPIVEKTGVDVVNARLVNIGAQLAGKDPKSKTKLYGIDGNTKYLQYFVQAGWSNQVICLKNAYEIALATGRGLILSPVVPHFQFYIKDTMDVRTSKFKLGYDLTNSFLRKVAHKNYIPLGNVLDLEVSLPGLVSTIDFRELYQRRRKDDDLTAWPLETNMSHFNTQWVRNQSTLEGSQVEIVAREHQVNRHYSQTYRDIVQFSETSPYPIWTLLDSYRVSLHESVYLDGARSSFRPRFQRKILEASQAIQQKRWKDIPYASVHIRGADGHFKNSKNKAITIAFNFVGLEMDDWIERNYGGMKTTTVGLFVATDIDDIRSNTVWQEKASELTKRLKDRYDVALKLLFQSDDENAGNLAQEPQVEALFNRNLPGWVGYPAVFLDQQLAACAPIGFVGTDGSSFSSFIHELREDDLRQTCGHSFESPVDE